ncbi:hypothetical protein BH10PLA2_BH10PLA2_26570 [soil metagenome]
MGQVFTLAPPLSSEEEGATHTGMTYAIGSERAANAYRRSRGGSAFPSRSLGTRAGGTLKWLPLLPSPFPGGKGDGDEGVDHASLPFRFGFALAFGLGYQLFQ